MIVRYWLPGAAAALAVVAVVGYGVSAAWAETERGSGPCAGVMGVATWSPSGKRITFVGVGGRSTAICVADADGRDAKPLRGATCPRRGYCRLINTPSELFWLRPNRIVYGDVVKGIFAVPLRGKPKRVGASTDTYGAFSVDARGDRVAYGSAACPNCPSPLTVLGVPTGSVVAKIGAPNTQNFFPSLSPDGKQVAFVSDSETSSSVRTASVGGTSSQQLNPCGGEPLWSPSGDEIACPGNGSKASALLLVSVQSGASTTLTPPVGAGDGVQNGYVFGWSPNSRHIALLYGRCSCRLDVVDVATGKLQQVLGRAGTQSYVAWSPNSRQLLVTEPAPPPNNNCFVVWRVPVEGAKPRRLRDCS